MKRIYRLAVVALLCGSTGLVACQSRRGRAVASQSPDEFMVLARSPLVVPPDYSLRPPSPGEPRAQDLNPEATARAALVGGRATAAAGTEGERLLLVKAKANEADPRIKEVVDDEQGDLAHKAEGFANLVMFWRKDQPTTVPVTPGANTSTPVDADAEAKRLASLTGGQAIVIKRPPPPEEKKNRRFKLPGL